MKTKKRIDQHLVEKGFVESRNKAQSMIMAGEVLLDDVVVQKPSEWYTGQEVRIKKKEHSFVSRGALKLQHALQEFKLSIDGLTGIDVGSSTGGFTEVLLQKGALKVYAVDSGTNQLHWKIRKDERVVVMEKTNAKYLTKDQFTELLDFAVFDLSFISLEKVAGAVLGLMKEKMFWVTLIKPQFELSSSEIGKGGIVREEEKRQKAVEKVKNSFESMGLKNLGIIDSPITGMDGNQEYLACWVRV